MNHESFPAAVLGLLVTHIIGLVWLIVLCLRILKNSRTLQRITILFEKQIAIKDTLQKMALQAKGENN